MHRCKFRCFNSELATAPHPCLGVAQRGGFVCTTMI